MTPPAVPAAVSGELTLAERCQKAREYHRDDRIAGDVIVRIPEHLFDELMLVAGRDEVHWKTRRSLLREIEELRRSQLEAGGAFEAARAELSNIAYAKRFDREKFDDDTSFADWAQSRARHTLATLPAARGE